MRILLADDHPIVRRHVRNVLLHEKGWEVCAEAKTGREAVLMAAAMQPDIAVLDLSMPELSGLEAARLIHEQFPDMEVIILTMYEPFELMDQLDGSGVRTCVMKTDLQDLVHAIRHLPSTNRMLSDTSGNVSDTLKHADKVEQMPARKN